MESSLIIRVITITLALALLISPSQSQTCSTQKFQTPNKKFKECVDLPELGSSIHFTYNAKNSSLDIAFVGYPEKPDGWVAWAINPNSTGMIGAQSFVGFKSNGAFVVKTYNIKSHAPIKESKLTFDSWGLAGESGSRSMTIFASMKVEEEAVKVNHVWNAGATVSDGIPDGHSMDEPHTTSLGVLNLVGGNVAPSSPPGTPPVTVIAPPKSGAADYGTLWIGSCLSGVILMGCFLGF
ncbi:Cytochrome b561 and DOMON domain-containing protein At3g25290 [Euphorbia peplus]|nr:Cytochrome b561 and DOMON domain-containing protein At3g25290 [Euphorbia peplus]